MSSSTPIATAYRLPYRVRYHPPPLFDGTVDVHVWLTRDADAAATAALDAIVAVFEHLAWTGALSGDAITPWGSSIGPVGRLSATGAHLVWRLEACRFDNSALPILSQLFLLSPATVAEIALTKGVTGAPLIVLAEDPRIANPYPAAFALGGGVPDIDAAASEDVSLFVRFARPLSGEDAATMESALMTWAAAAAMGCYGQAPEPPERCGLTPGELTFFADEVELSLHRFRAHGSALNGLSNAVLAFHRSIAPVLELLIE